MAQSSQDSSLSHEPNTPLAAGTGNPECVEQFLVSSPGLGALDSGCGRSIIGEETLHDFGKMWEERGLPKPAWIPETNHFRYGNGEKETTRFAIKIRVVLGTKSGTSHQRQSPTFDFTTSSAEVH